MTRSAANTRLRSRHDESEAALVHHWRFRNRQPVSFARPAWGSPWSVGLTDPAVAAHSSAGGSPFSKPTPTCGSRRLSYRFGRSGLVEWGATRRALLLISNLQAPSSMRACVGGRVRAALRLLDHQPAGF